MVNITRSPKSTILARLRAAGGPVSGSELAGLIGASRVAAWKHLEALREAGYDIESDHAGYRLASEGDFLHAWEFPGREDRIRRFERTDSTMDRALELALDDPRGRAIVLAESQTRGRGRRGRGWSSPQGGLFATMVVDPDLPPWRIERLAMAGSIALCLALRDITGEPFITAWPNDIHIASTRKVATRKAASRKAASRKAASRKAASRKAAGLLVEYLVEGDTTRLALLGLGVNVANRAPSEEAFSLRELPGPHPSRRAILEAFLDRFESMDLQGRSLAQTWNSLSAQAGGIVLSREDGRRLGRALAVDDEGRLVVELDGGGSAAFRPGEAALTEKEHHP